MMKADKVITRADLVKALQDKGIGAEAKDIVKNGVVLEGIIFTGAEKYGGKGVGRDNVRDGNNGVPVMCPVVYTEGLLKRINEAEIGRGARMDKVVERLMESVREEMKGAAEIKVEELMERENILRSVCVGLQKSGDEDIVKQESGLDGLEAYLYVRGTVGGKDKRGERGYTAKVTKGLLETAGVDVEEAWKSAWEHLKEGTTIKSLAKVMCELMGMELEPWMEEGTTEGTGGIGGIYVVSNREGYRGAANILDKEALKRFGREKGIRKIVVLPSSIHETLIVKYGEDTNLDEMSAMVTEVNQMEVTPEERLTDRAYVMEI